MDMAKGLYTQAIIRLEILIELMGKEIKKDFELESKFYKIDKLINNVVQICIDKKIDVIQEEIKMISALKINIYEKPIFFETIKIYEKKQEHYKMAMISKAFKINFCENQDNQLF